MWDRIKWRAQVKYKLTTLNLGRYETEEAAARAYDAKAKELFVNPILNFLPVCRVALNGGCFFFVGGGCLFGGVAFISRTQTNTHA